FRVPHASAVLSDASQFQPYEVQNRQLEIPSAAVFHVACIPTKRVGVLELDPCSSLILRSHVAKKVEVSPALAERVQHETAQRSRWLWLRYCRRLSTPRTSGGIHPEPLQNLSAIELRASRRTTRLNCPHSPQGRTMRSPI